MAFKKKNLKRSNKVNHQKKYHSKKPRSLKKKKGGCNPTTVDCLNPHGLSQMGVNPYESPPTVSEQAFDQRYSWSGNDIAGSGVGNQVECPAKTDVAPASEMTSPMTEEMSGGKKKKKKNKKSAKKKRGGGYYLNLGTEKIGNQALVTGYDDCAPPTLKTQYQIV